MQRWAFWQVRTVIEGTLFGNGERTGNVDIVTLAMNMYSQGVDPELDFSEYAGDRRVLMRAYTGMKVDERSPYGGGAGICSILRFSSGCDRKGHELPGGERLRDTGPYRICRSTRPTSDVPTMQM